MNPGSISCWAQPQAKAITEVVQWWASNSNRCSYPHKLKWRRPGPRMLHNQLINSTTEPQQWRARKIGSLKIWTKLYRDWLVRSSQEPSRQELLEQLQDERTHHQGCMVAINFNMIDLRNWWSKTCQAWPTKEATQTRVSFPLVLQIKTKAWGNRCQLQQPTPTTRNTYH